MLFVGGEHPMEWFGLWFWLSIVAVLVGLVFLGWRLIRREQKMIKAAHLETHMRLPTSEMRARLEHLDDALEDASGF